MLILADAYIPAGTLKQVTYILVGVLKGQISRERCVAEQTFTKFAFCDYF